MKVLDLFSGIGGFSLGLERAGMETVAFCEIEEYPRQVLKKHWPQIPIAGDIRKLSYKRIIQELIYDGEVIYVGPIDLICGGYPCQPFSTAGKRQGEEDDRHLWPEYLRLIREIRPRWVIGENVAGHISMGLDAVLSDLESEGYAWEPFVIPACAIDAKHRRDRVWIVANTSGRRFSGEKEGKIQQPRGTKTISTSSVANSNSIRRRQEQISELGSENKAESGDDGETKSLANTARSNDRGSNTGEVERQTRELGNCGSAQNVADTQSQPERPGLCEGGKTGNGQRRLGDSCRKGNVSDTRNEGLSKPEQEAIFRKRGREEGRTTTEFCRWPIEPGVGRVAHGVPRRVDRLKGLGNAVVPDIPEIFGLAIMEIESNIN